MKRKSWIGWYIFRIDTYLGSLARVCRIPAKYFLCNRVLTVIDRVDSTFHVWIFPQIQMIVHSPSAFRSLAATIALEDT